MNDLAGFPPRAFDKADPSPDPLFYRQPRLVTHIDDNAIAAVTELYRRFLPTGGTVLDLMSSWVSHLPHDVAYARVVGHGMNADELAANPRLDERFVSDLNADPTLSLPDAHFDAACMCVSVQYLQRPIEVFREVARVLRPGAPFVVTFSNRCFPTKAVAIWQALAGPDQQQLVALYMQRAGFGSIDASEVVPDYGDPIWAVIGHADGTETG
jgi:SAM-dependent methyltransferase